VDARRPTVLVVGERNSGTNYVDQLVAANLAVTTAAGVIPARYARAAQRLPEEWRERVIDTWFSTTRTVWKHGLIDDAAVRRLRRRDVFPVGVVKHPLAWAVSMRQRPYHRFEHHTDLADFCSTPWRTIGRERTGRRTFANCFELWAVKQRALLDLADRGDALVWRYEAVMEDELAHLVELADRLSVPAPSSVAAVGPSTKADVAGDARDAAAIREQYQTEAWRAEVPAEIVDLARGSCGDVADRLGYAI
jgi:hypothetical protein